MEYYPQNSILIRKVMNGFIVTAKGTREMQEDNQNGEYVFLEYVFLTATALSNWLYEYYGPGEMPKTTTTPHTDTVWIWDESKGKVVKAEAKDPEENQTGNILLTPKEIEKRVMESAPRFNDGRVPRDGANW